MSTHVGLHTDTASRVGPSLYSVRSQTRTCLCGCQPSGNSGLGVRVERVEKGRGSGTSSMALMCSSARPAQQYHGDIMRQIHHRQIRVLVSKIWLLARSTPLNLTEAAVKLHASTKHLLA